MTLASFLFGAVLGLLLRTSGPRASRSRSRAIVTSILWPILAAPVAALTAYVSAGLYFYRPRAWLTFLFEIARLATSAVGRPWLVLYVGLIAGLLVARRAGCAPGRAALIAFPVLLFHLIGPSPVRAHQALLGEAPPSGSDLRSLASSDQIVFVSTRSGLEPVCWCGPRDWSVRSARYLGAATIAIEDRRFFDHRGTDPQAVIRAALSVFRPGRIEGGSTLTAQLIKNTALTAERSLQRKYSEMRLSERLEDVMSKEEILDLYLKQAPFGWSRGRPIIGAEQASRHYFGRRAQDLNIIESAQLAGMLKAPALFDPIEHPLEARQRANIVLDAMVAQGVLQPAEAEAAKTSVRPRGAYGPIYAHTGPLIGWVLAEIRRSDPSIVFDASTRIPITLDYTAQARAEAAVEQIALPSAMSRLELGFMSIARDGGVRIMVAQRRPGTATMNYATDARRQPASTFKTFVYAQALASGLIVPSKALTAAFAASDNKLPIKLAKRLGPKAIVKFVRGLGPTSPLRADASIALGTSEVTLTELVGAYAAVVEGGGPVAPFAYLGVMQNGAWRARRPTPPIRQLEPKVVATLEHLMRQVVVVGTGRPAAKVPNAFGKTGTSDDNRDGWFVGVLPHSVSGIWMGVPKGEGTPNLTGRCASSVWARIEGQVREGDDLVVRRSAERRRLATAGSDTPRRQGGTGASRDVHGLSCS